MKTKKIKDLNVDYVKMIKQTVSLEKAWDYMVEKCVRTLPVADENDEFCGIVTMGDISECYLHDIEGIDMKTKKIPLENILHTLGGKCLSECEEMVALKDLTFVKNKTEEVSEGVIVIQTPYSEATINRIIVRSIPVGEIMKTEDLQVLHLDEEIESLIRAIVKKNYRYFPVLDKKENVIGVISREEVLYRSQTKIPS